MTNTRPADNVLADSWTIDGNDELVTLIDDMFTRDDDTNETETRTHAELVAMDHADKLNKNTSPTSIEQPGSPKPNSPARWASPNQGGLHRNLNRSAA